MARSLRAGNGRRRFRGWARPADGAARHPQGLSSASRQLLGLPQADKTTKTGLAGYLGERGIKRCFVAGLATDFCVAWTAIDAAGAGFTTFVIEDASRAIDAAGSLATALGDMDRAGARRIEAATILG